MTSATSSLSASQSKSESESESESVSEAETESTSDPKTEADPDDKAPDPDTDSDSDDSNIDTPSSPPISMLMSAANSGPSSDANADADAEADPATASDDENPAPDTTPGTKTNVDASAHSVPASRRPETAVVSHAAWETGARPVHPDTVSALRISTLVLAAASLAAGVEVSVGALESGAGAPTSAAIQSKSLPGGFVASVPTAGVNGSFTGGALRMGKGRGLGLEGGMSGGWVVLGLCFVAWGVL
ncbi:hypothetical protein EYC84_006787 [Monilinia fructicola]|uniref:Uncharacterized protein n=1 Tax=Monilinia fructicola TaxID=38448 RepID=A0A5M9K886_MONFR|nr:hypothetical protein EYC84_006787 [Monilinia fructicola]